MYALISLLILLSYPSSYVLAQKSQEYIQYAADRIYRDCDGAVLKVENYFLSFFPLPLVDQNDELSIPQNWELEKPSYAEIIKIFDFLEKWPFPGKEDFFSGNLINGKEITIKDGKEVVKGIRFRTKNGQEVRFKLDGRRLFSCGSKFLDIEGNKYIWGGEVLELPRYQYESMIKIQDFIFLKVSMIGLELSLWQITILPVLIFIPVYRRFIYKNKRVDS